MSQQFSASQPAEAALAEDAVKFQSDGSNTTAGAQAANALTAGTTIKYYAGGDTASFYIKDGALNVEHSGKTYFMPENAANNDGTITLNTGVEGKTDVPVTTDFDLNVHNQVDTPIGGIATVVDNQDVVNANASLIANTLALSTGAWVDTTTSNCGAASGTAAYIAGQNSTGPWAANTTACYLDPTPLANGEWANSKISTVGLTAMTFRINDATYDIDDTTDGVLIANYKFNIPDTYAIAKNRAHVVSSSDAVGEYVAITEVAGEGSRVANNNTSFFRGQVSFQTDASHAAKGTVKSGTTIPSVWVQDGDTVTVTYMEACTMKTDNSACETDGAVVSTATATIDTTKPSISNIAPADGTLTSDTSPTISFTITDDGAGFNSSIASFADHINLEVNGCTVAETTEVSVTAHSSSSVTVSYDLGGTTLYSTTAEKTAGNAAATANATDHVATRCNVHTEAGGNERQIASTGFSVDTTTKMIQDGLDGAGHTDGGANGDYDFDRTIHGKIFNWKIVATDEVGNAKTIETTDLELTIDSVAPAAATSTPVVAGKMWDAAQVKDVDDISAIKVTFTESVDQSSVQASDFLISGTGVTDATISEVSFGGTAGATDMHVYLDLAADLAPNATPKVELVGQVSDIAGNVWKVPSSDTDGKVLIGNAADGVKPTVSAGAHSDNFLDNNDKTTFTWSTDENMVDGEQNTAGTCTCVYIVGGNASNFDSKDTALKVKAVTLTSPTTGKVELKNGVTDDGLAFTSGRFGVIVAAEDAGGNHGIGGIVKVASEDISKYVTAGLAFDSNNDEGDVSGAIKLKNWPLADHDGDGTLKDAISAWTINGVTHHPDNIEVRLIDWTEAETISVRIPDHATAQTHATCWDTGGTVYGGAQCDDKIPANAVVKITYHYVDDSHVVEMDELAPTVAITPSNDSSTENARQRITLAFDEDEYAGDTHTTVTVTKAELKDPDGNVTDILGSLITSDDKSFYYKPTSDLALGQYTVTTSAKDDNDNALTDSTSKFTVNEKADTVIAMEAGWNLVSVPSTPADTAINSVITNEEVTTVLTYDPATPGGWLTAVRDGGSLVGTLSTIDATRAYWIYQEDGDDIKTLIPSTSSGVQQAPPAIALAKGWNLVPVVSLNNTVVSGTTGLIEADDYFANIDWNKAKGWDATNETWWEILKGQDNRDTDGDGDTDSDLADDPDDYDMKPGEGFWVFANKAGTLVP
jgi:hypothetical protein